MHHLPLAHAIRFLRTIGVAVALDDFGDGKSSLRLWAELQPEYLKIDRYFCHGINGSRASAALVAARHSSIMRA
jgi:EAL domain-containing protein (putative c-di-GMP-specific phosphodiesterase class I)